MSTCRRQDGARGRQTTGSQAARPASAAQEPAVRRYAHPIQTARPCRGPSAEELLVQVQAALERQTALLEEIFRQVNGNGTDTN